MFLVGKMFLDLILYSHCLSSLSSLVSEARVQDLQQYLFNTTSPVMYYIRPLTNHSPEQI